GAASGAADPTRAGRPPRLGARGRRLPGKTKLRAFGPDGSTIAPMIPLSPDSADLRPLDENDLVRLDALLDETGNENAMVVEEIDGFLAALACVPDVIDEEAVLGHVLGLEPGEDAASGAGDGVP